MIIQRIQVLILKTLKIKISDLIYLKTVANDLKIAQL